MGRKKKLGFALGSGGSRGVAHIGFLQAMSEAGIEPDFISGCSMGSVVGAAYASGLTPAEMKKAVCALRFFDLLDITNKPGGLLDTRKMRRLLARYIGDRTFDELKVPFSCVAVDMLTQRVVEFKEGSVLDAVVSSSSIPTIFKPQERDGMRLVDGGILTRVPVQEVRGLGAKKVIAVDVLGNRSCRDKCPNAVVVLTEVVDIMDNYRTARYKKDHKRSYDLWLEPDLGDMSQYTFRNLAYAYDQGYALGVENREKILEIIG